MKGIAQHLAVRATSSEPLLNSSGRWNLVGALLQVAGHPNSGVLLAT